MTWSDNLEVSVEQKNLLDVSGGGIVCPVTVQLEAYGQISQKLVQRTNGTISQAVSMIRNQLPQQALALGRAVSLPWDKSFGLDVERIILVAMWDRESPYSANLFYSAYISALREANQCGLKTVAMPIMGYDGNLKAACESFVSVVKDMDRLRNSDTFSVEDIFLVSTNENHCKIMQDIVAKSM